MATTKAKEAAKAEAKTQAPSYTVANSTNRYSSLNQRKADFKASQPAPAAAPVGPPAPPPLSDNDILAGQYQQYINQQKKGLSKASDAQLQNIQAIQDRNKSMIDTHLGAIQNSAGASENAFLKALNDSNTAAMAGNQARRDEFAAGNAQSLANIANSQSQIQGVPGYSPVGQISNRAETVSPWDNLGKIGVKRTAVKLNTLTAQFGFNKAQVSSRKRQQLGVQGLRVGT
jgi:hypothetical protein